MKLLKSLPDEDPIYATGIVIKLEVPKIRKLVPIRSTDGKKVLKYKCNTTCNKYYKNKYLSQNNLKYHIIIFNYHTKTTFLFGKVICFFF